MDQFAEQVKAAAKFKVFRDDQQKIVWAQSYLMGSAWQWSSIITTGLEDPELNLRCFHWDTWLADFWAVFCIRNPTQDALTCLDQLQQGSKSITNYCMTFFYLKGRLGHADVESEYVKDHFWKGLSAAAMEALKMAEEAWDILLRCESKLADIAARKKGGWHSGQPHAPSTPAPTHSMMSTTKALVCLVLPSSPADPNTMDVDHAKSTLVG